MAGTHLWIKHIYLGLRGLNLASRSFSALWSSILKEFSFYFEHAAGFGLTPSPFLVKWDP